MDGSRPSFARIIVLRTWVPLVVSWMGTVGMWAGLADVLFIIFRSNRRCLHDEIAGTKVVPVTAPPPPPP